MAQLQFAIGNKGSVDIGSIIFNPIATHVTSEKVNHSIGFPSLIYELLMKQSPQMEVIQSERLETLSSSMLIPSSSPGSIRMALRAQAAQDVEEDVPTSSSLAVTFSISSSIKEKIIRNLEAEIKFMTSEITMITNSRKDLSNLL